MALRLTIAIPNYNGGENLRRAIRSCKYIRLNQKDFEILVIDNKSTDDSIQVVNALKNEFSNIRIWQNDANVGRVQNWNVCLDKAKGKYLVLLFTNDLIGNDNNIHEVLDTLDADESISLVISALVKKEMHSERIKKKYFDKPVKCPSLDFTKNTITRGMFPFGTIESIIYRTEDIHDSNTRFMEKLPINADEVFSYTLAIRRKYILFNPYPQIIWDLTQNRFHGKMKVEDEFKEHAEAIEMIKKIDNMKVNYGLLFTYRLVNLLKYSINSSQKNFRMWGHLFSEMISRRCFFVADTILIKTLLGKLSNPKKDADDIFFKNIITKCT
jgi:glycosyltransferase involved in cell wall biosynthesis